MTPGEAAAAFLALLRRAVYVWRVAMLDSARWYAKHGEVVEMSEAAS